jgi:L1 cell adhesion molecule like protein
VTAVKVTTIFIKRNTAVPTKETHSLSTYSDNQQGVVLQVYDGKLSMKKVNNRLGMFELMGISPFQCQFPQIEVIFDIDPNGILNVTALD